MALSINARESVLLANTAQMIIKKDGDEMDAARRLKCYTADDIYNLPDGQRAELIDGQMYMMVPPNWTHQRISGKLYQRIANYIDTNDGKCEIVSAPFAVFLNKNEDTYVEPDISVICDKDKLNEKGCHGAPDWIIEIVSPSSRQMDYNKKLFLYRTAGVREYWIVDPTKQWIMVYNFEHDIFGQYSFSDKIKAGIYEGFEIDFTGVSIE